MKIRSAVKTHVGLVRTNNEDSHLCDEASGLYAVADGMGGHAAGEMASRLAIEALRNHNPNGHPHPREQLAAVFAYAHDVILADARSWPARSGSGTTMTALYLVDEARDGTSHVAHVGDSRCYLIRNGVGRQLTQDHAIPGTNVLLNCLGSKPGAHIKTDIITEQVQPGDVFILCSDGLSNLPLDHIEKVVGLYRNDLPELCECLVYHANKRDGTDNITVVVVAVEAE